MTLARALYEDSDLLVLDEVTTALDREARDAVAAILASSRGRRTVLLATHDRDLLLLCAIEWSTWKPVRSPATARRPSWRCAAGLARILEGPPGEVASPVQVT